MLQHSSEEEGVWWISPAAHSAGTSLSPALRRRWSFENQLEPTQSWALVFPHPVLLFCCPCYFLFLLPLYLAGLVCHCGLIISACSLCSFQPANLLSFTVSVTASFCLTTCPPHGLGQQLPLFLVYCQSLIHIPLCVHCKEYGFIYEERERAHKMRLLMMMMPFPARMHRPVKVPISVGIKLWACWLQVRVWL